MLRDFDLEIDEFYAFKETDGGTGLRQFKSVLSNGDLQFKDSKTGNKRNLPQRDFKRLRGLGAIARVLGQGSAMERTMPDPRAGMDPQERGINRRERDRRIAAARALFEGRTLFHYILAMDALGNVKRSTKKLNRFTADTYESALAMGFMWRPSASAIRRAWLKGVPGRRHLDDFVSQRGKHSAEKWWPKLVLELKAMTVEHYWSSITVSKPQAKAFFYSRFDRANAETVSLGGAAMKRPCATTLDNWINDAETYDRCVQRYGLKATLTRYKGHSLPLQPLRPLHYVLLDQTEVDWWTRILNDQGEVIGFVRPWLVIAMDLFSRMILGAFLSLEPPSVYSLMACVKQVVRYKDFLVDEYGEHKGATDGFGKPIYFVVDNGRENVGVSFQVMCERAGIGLIFAPKGTPQYKASVERFFGILNEHLWHRLPGGILKKPDGMKELELKPQEDTVLSIEEVYPRLWRTIVTMHHVEVHEGIGMAPARKWKLGIERHGRPMVDDIATLDVSLGQTVTCTITPQGIKLDGQIFHHPEIISGLINDLAAFGSAISYRHKVPKRHSIVCAAVKHQEDCSYIDVWNPKRKCFVMVPNKFPDYSRMLSWAVAKRIREFADSRNLEFHSDVEMMAARDAHYATLVPSIEGKPVKKSRKDARALEAERKRLVAGSIVEEKFVTPSASGSMSQDVPTSYPAKEREGPALPVKGPVLGARKAAQTRARNAQKAKKATKPKPAFEYFPDPIKPLTTVEDLGMFVIPDADDALAAIQHLL